MDFARVDVEGRGAAFATLRWGRPVSPYGIARDAGGRTWLALAGYDDPTVGVPTYGFTAIHADGTTSGHASPDGVRMPDLFRRRDGVVWTLGHMEGKGELEVLSPVDGAPIGKPVRRFAASEETVLGTPDACLVRFVRDSSMKKAARVVWDPLQAKQKRRALELPKAPYPLRAWAGRDGAGDVHVLAQGLHRVFDAATLEQVGEHVLALSGIGHVTPLELGRDGTGSVIAAREATLGIADIGGDFTALFTLPDTRARFYSVWAAVPFGDDGVAVRFTFGADEPRLSGNGYVLLRGRRLVASFASAGDDAYVDETGARHAASAGARLVLSHLDVSGDGSSRAIFYRDGDRHHDALLLAERPPVA
jgi:hypothetical protein